ncbi:MAG: DUF72 domain-containing protein [Pirellulales bacterium]|nr:DUF72 domain-containing protein [Pirellulales bacterium]
MPGMIRVGCAGWSLRKEHFALFPAAGSHLERYAASFDCVEINSSFYRSHRVATYQRWAEATPRDFRFAVKVPKQITHIYRLSGTDDAVAQFAAEVGGLGAKLGAVLVQLPPSLAFEGDFVSRFFKQLTDAILCPVVVEPRHVSWFDDEVTSFLLARSIARVVADPAVTPAAAEPIAANGFTYYRWHGSPRVYYSSYDQSTLINLSQSLVTAATSHEAWCIFDNTAAGAATTNALSLRDYVTEAVAREGSLATH